MDRSTELRAFFARYVTAKAGARDPRIQAAFAAVPKEDFVGPPPWHIFAPGPWWTKDSGTSYVETPSGDPAYLYQDVLVALDPARGINIGEPSLHALCLDSLGVEPGDTVIQVGAGSGYYSALLAHLTGSTGHVHAFEIDPDMASRATHNLVPWTWVTVEVRSGAAAGLPAADAIYVNAGLPQPSLHWLEALKPGGRLIFPLQAERSFGGMLRIEKPRHGGTAWPARFISRAGFIPCQGQQSETTGRRLAAAFASGDWESVRSIHLNDDPGDTCWFDGGGWWLSTAEP